jgi:cytochrome P450 family 135
MSPPALPDGPNWSLARSTLQWWRRPLDVLELCHARYGDMFTYRFAHEGTWVFVSDPEAVKQVFTGDPRLLHAGEANIVLLPVLGQQSVLLLDEPAHMAQRKLMLPSFHGERMQRYGELMSGVAAEEIERWPSDRRLKVRPRMQAVTLEVILRAVFGIAEGERQTRLRDELRGLLDAISDPRRAIFLLVLGPERIRRYPPFRRAMERVDVLVIEEIRARRASADLADREDILSLLLQARHEDGREMSDRELRDELMTLLVAGHETTATALSWAIELLARHPAELARLEAEVDSGEDGYLDAVIKETLRLRPVISLVLRKLVEPMEIGGRMLPAGVSVAPCIYLVHRRPDVYPEPERFRPERFFEQDHHKTGGASASPAAPPRAYTWIPFGGGVRRCLGGAFAEFEMQVVLRELVARRALRPGGRGAERPVRRTITNVPSRGAEVIAAPRRPNGGRPEGAPTERREPTGASAR